MSVYCSHEADKYLTLLLGERVEVCQAKPIILPKNSDLNYVQALEEYEPERIVYLAVPEETYKDFFQLNFIQRTIEKYQMKLIIYEPKKEEIILWIK